MSQYAELVKALRLCQFGECGCGKCYYKELKGDWCTEDNHPEFFDCDDKLKLDAAAAIEELQAEVKRLNMRCADCEYAASEWPEDPEHTKTPKRGEWIIHGEPPMLVIECSVCGQKYFNHVMQEKAKYCSMCGAKMGGTE